jgi:hypothetical protein
LPVQFSISGSPVTTTGTLTGSWVSQTANNVFTAPNGAAGVPTFRLLVAADIPSLDASKITTGTFAIARGGTGQTTANNALNALLPSQTSQANKFLQTDGTNTSWQTTPTTSPAGSNTEVQYNNSGVFGANSGLIYNGTNLAVGGGANTARVNVFTSGGDANIFQEGNKSTTDNNMNKTYYLNELVTGGSGTWTEIARYDFPTNAYYALMLTADITAANDGGGQVIFRVLGGFYDLSGAGAAQRGATATVIGVADSTQSARFSVSGDRVSIEVIDDGSRRHNWHCLWSSQLTQMAPP